MSQQRQNGSTFSDRLDFNAKSNKRQRRALSKNKGDKLTRRCNSCKYLRTQPRSAQIYKTINDKHKGNNQQYNSRGTQPPLTAMDRAPEETINKVTMVLNDTLDQMGLPINSEHSILKQHNTYSFQVHMEHPPEEITYQATKQASTHSRISKSYDAPFSDHRAMKREVNHNKKSGRTTNTQRISNMLLNNESVTQEN